jgi:outer membrane protein assembly factor BamB
VTVYPGFWGGNETPASLADGVLYVLTVNMPTPYTATAWGARDGEHAVHNLEGRTKYADGTSEVDALDVATGKIKWTRKLPAVGFAATTVVNDLVFTATYDGKIYALSRLDGRIVWTYQAPGGIIAWPAVAADTIIWPVGLGRNPMLLALRLGAKLPVAQPRARPQAPPPPK